jgi:hypothetical protein
MVSGGSSVVKQQAHYPEFNCSNPAATLLQREREREIIVYKSKQLISPLCHPNLK